MSLQLAAKHLAAHGRGKDTELIHMDKGEIASLQQIAKANGGSLTINPHTGLPEAGFLSAMLPMIAGAGLMMIPGMQAMGAAGIVGALKTAQSGSLQKGIMAGLGAYGGAGLAGSAGAAGAAMPTPTPTPNPIYDFGPHASVGEGLASTAPSTAVSTTAGATGTATPLASSNQAFNAATQNNINGLTTTPAESFGATNPNAGVQPQTAGGAQSNPVYDYGPRPASFDTMTASQRASAIGRGASFENAGNFIGDNPKTAAGAVLGVAAGMHKDPEKVEPDRDMGQRYSYSANTASPLPEPDVPTYEDMLTKQGNFGRQQKYFTPSYTPISASAAKDLYHFAAGGPVEQMSNNAAIGANTMYPMANMTTSAFATPYQDPRATNMMSAMAPSGGGTVDAMSGEPNMQGTRLASGGNVELRGHFTADGGQGGSGGGFGGQGANGYSAVGSGGDGNSFNPDAARDPGYQQGDTFQPQGTRAFSGNPQQAMQSIFALLGGRPAGNAYATQAAPAAPVQELPVGIGPPVMMAEGGIPRYGFGGRLNLDNLPSEDSDRPPAGPLEALLRMGRTKQADANPGLKYAYNPDDQQYVQQQATGGLSDAHYNLGGYSDGGRLLRGPGDGVSDSIPAVIGKKQPARLADGEFVVPARIVSELGNGSTEAGARKLYAMMDRIQASRKNTVGKGKVAKNNRADKYLPA